MAPEPPYCGVTGAEADDGGLLPRVFVATTVKVTEVPSLIPSTTADVEEPDTVAVWPEEEVTAYVLMGLPEADAIQLTVAWPSPGVALTPVGATGIEVGGASVMPGEAAAGFDVESR